MGSFCPRVQPKKQKYDQGGATLSEPLRTCIGCREKTAQTDLVRLVCECTAGTDMPKVVFDEQGRRPGRGAWIHHNPGCLAIAQKKGSFNRAFRRRVNASELVIKA